MKETIESVIKKIGKLTFEALCFLVALFLAVKILSLFFGCSKKPEVLGPKIERERKVENKTPEFPSFCKKKSKDKDLRKCVKWIRKEIRK